MTTSLVYKLHSDEQFMRTWKGYPDTIYVYEYKGDPTAFGVIYADDSRWSLSVAVGSSATAQFKELEVFGVKIGGDQLKELAKDLTLVDKSAHTFHLMVNRQGLCLLHLAAQSVKWVRNNDRFGWSKYGVKVGPEKSGGGGGSMIWDVCDMSNGDVLIDGKGEGECDHGGEYPPSSCGGWKKVVAEKEKQVAALKAAVRALIDGGEK